MDRPERPAVAPEDTARRHQAKARLYVFFQSFGWGILLLFQSMASVYFSTRHGHPRLLQTLAAVAMIVASGLLLSHFSRRLLRRWDWKQLGWRQLLPRVIVFAVALSLIWSIFGYGYLYGVVRLPWPEANYSPLVMFSLSWLNGTLLYVGWLCVYFFYHLFDRFNRSEIERLRLTAHVKEAELRALKSQVNPHFIFNSLNSLRALIDENPPRAREAVTQLAHLLRYSLQSGQLETVPFESELRAVHDYLALEQVRHEERLRVRLDVDPETLTLPIPPMLLQTLVENAVKYGISVLPEGGEVAVIARREADSLRLQVTNPGALADAPARHTAASTGVGLRNAADRLRLLFGERASLQLRADGDALVVAEAVVPLAPTSA
jgi:signal transduction histidine kinase